MPQPAQHTEGRAPGRTRTSDTRFRKPVLYPLSYGGVGCIVRGQEGADSLGV